MIHLRPATIKDAKTILALNDAAVDATSPMDLNRFENLFEISHHCIVAERDSKILGFILAMKEGAPYENQNFKWFSERLKNFVYIDRIVIDESGRGEGIGTQFYNHLSELSEKDGVSTLAAEIYLIPPNQISLNFHNKNGFIALDSTELKNGKVVSMQIKNIE